MKIRQEMLIKRNALQKQDVFKKSKLINQKLIKIAADAKNILAYFPFKNEVDIREFLEFVIKKNGFVVLPRVVGNDLKFFIVHDLKCELGYSGILEPCVDAPEFTDFNAVDLVIVPGVVFDKDCNRIGMGKGFYDRFLAKLLNKNFIGVGYDFQVVEKIDVKSTDVAMQMLITECREIKKGRET